MMSPSRLLQRLLTVVAAATLVHAHPAWAAPEYSEDMVGQDADAWAAWREASRAMDREERDVAVKAIETVLATNPSDLRLALMADRTGSLALETWAKSPDAPEPVRKAAEKVKAGKNQRALAEDGWHFAAIGRFKFADASFKALDATNPDPVALLELARLNPNRHAILVKLMNNAEVGESARRFLQILDLGEEKLRMDPNEIALNVSKLRGPPRMVYNASNRLKTAGEYAIPHLLQSLRDPAQRELHAQIIQLLPQIGRDGLNPLCMALGISDDVTRQVIINAVTQIGYRQAIPYLAKVANNPGASEDSRAAARAAMSSLGGGGANQATLFLELAEGYYDNADSLRADPRRDTANVWYLRNDELRLVTVPAVIFNDVMAMRASEESLLANPDLEPATALWIAANIRREAKLGLDVESDRPDVLAAKDSTRPEDYPRSIYFARAAGPKYSHMVLARALRDRDPGVALGAIAALRETAGEPSLVGAEDLKQPLVQTLAFPNRQVRVKAALAIGAALPKTNFSGAQNVVPVLAEALAQANRQAAMIVDPDADTLNKMQAVLSAAGYECAGGSSLNRAREVGRKANLSTFDVIVLASDMSAPDVVAAIAELRREFQTAATPILVLAKQGQSTLASSAARTAPGVEVLLSDIFDIGNPKRISEMLDQRIARASKAMGMTPLNAEQSLSLALQAADVLRMIAQSNLKVLDVSAATGALMAALNSSAETLRVKAATALALHPSRDGQTALAEAALSSSRAAPERLALFGSLAESARVNGNLIGGGDLVARLIDFTMKEQDLVLRAAGSQALGALDLPGNKASQIIRSQYRG